MWKQDRPEDSFPRSISGVKMGKVIEATELVGKGTEESPYYLEHLIGLLTGNYLPSVLPAPECLSVSLLAAIFVTVSYSC